MVVGGRKIPRESGRRGNRGRALHILERSGIRLRWRVRAFGQDVVMVVMMTVRVSSCHGVETGVGILMVVMRVSLGALRSADGGESSSAIIIGLAVLLFQLSAFTTPAPARTFAGRAIRGFLRRHVCFLAAGQAGVCKGQLSAGRDRTGNAEAADTAPDAREHAAELALDAWLRDRSLQLGLGALNSLRERGNAALSVDFLDP